jgi:signal transduction histidine kinase/CheY-like chemotaxis protein
MKDRWQRLPRAAGTVLAAILLLFGLLVVTQADTDYRHQQQQRVQVRAGILAASVTAAVDFGDMEAVREALAPFRVDPASRGVGVYTADGRLMAGIAMENYALPETLPRSLPRGNYSIGAADVVSGGKKIGTAFLVSQQEPLSRRLSRYALIAILAVMAALVVLILGLSQAALRRANQELQDTNDELVQQMAERERVENELRQVQKMESIGQLTGGIAHDFNNMLAIVIGSLDIAERRFATNPDRTRTAIAHALEGANRAAALTKRLLAFARRSPLQPQPIDPNQMVANMSELLRRTLGEGVVIETVLAGGLWRTHADPGQLENAILNLCINARDAMSNGGGITVETANTWMDDPAAKERDMERGQYVAICVTDTGSGMSKEVIARAFDPFFTTKPTGQGTGLGLSMVFGFARQSDGQARIYSEPGQGTTVKIYLPRHMGKSEEEEVESEISKLPSGEGETVLVVDDEPTIRMLIGDTLTELGYRGIEAADAATGLKVLESDVNIDLLITDVGLPGGMNGKDMADAARGKRPKLKVLFITGYAENAAITNGHLEPGMQVMSKPFSMDKLATRIRSIIEHN